MRRSRRLNGARKTIIASSEDETTDKDSIFSESDNDTNAAMSNLKMWQSLGFALQFALGIKGLPLYGKSIEYSVYICSGLLLVGLLCLSMVLADDRRSDNNNN